MVIDVFPRQLGDPLEICADNLRLHRFASGALQASQLALDFGARLLGELQLRQLVAELLHLFRLIVVAQLLLDRFELLAQEHLALSFAQLFLNLRLDLLLSLQHPDLALDVDEHAAQALLDTQRLQESLLFRDRELDVAGHQVGELARIVHRVEHLVHHFFRQAALLAELLRAFPRFLVQCFERGVLVVEGDHLLGRNNNRREVPVAHSVLQRCRALLALQEQLDTTQTPLDLPDAGDDAHRIQDLGFRFVRVVALRDGKHQAIALERRFDGAQGARSARGDGIRDAGEDDRSTQWKHGKRLSLSHGIPEKRVHRRPIRGEPAPVRCSP
jgi:hypothetical protein